MNDDRVLGVCATCGGDVKRIQRRPPSRSGERPNPAIYVLACSVDDSHNINDAPTS